MPIQDCQVDGRKGKRWGKQGRCYTGPGARRKALRQSRAIKASQVSNEEREDGRQADSKSSSSRSLSGTSLCNDRSNSELFVPLAIKSSQITQNVLGSLDERLVHLTDTMLSVSPARFVLNRTQIVPSNPLKADPTRTATLRRKFETAISVRFARLRREIVDLVAVEDVFGLRNRVQNPFEVNTSGSPSNEGVVHQAGETPASLAINNEEQDNGTGKRRTDLRPSKEGTGEVAAAQQQNEGDLEARSRKGVDGSTLCQEKSVLGGDGNRVFSSDSLLQNPSTVVLNQQREQDNGNSVQGKVEKRAGRGDISRQAVSVSEGVDNGSSNSDNRVSNRVGNSQVSVLNQRWAFRSDAEKLRLFQEWLQAESQLEILAGAQAATDEAYWQAFVEEGYRKGAGRAFNDTRKAALASGTAEEALFEGTRLEFLRSSFARPVAIGKVKLLAGRVFTDLKGVTEVMNTKMTRILAEGLAQGQNPAEMARTMIKDGMGFTKRRGIQSRAMTIARTEIIRAHAEGQLDAMEDLGVTEVGVMAEWSTAGDDIVCPLCADLDGIVITVKEARGLIPRHPNCRCSHIPANVGESQKGQKRGKVKVQKAIDDSVRETMPKGRQVKGEGLRFQNPETGRYTMKTSKRTLAQQKNRSQWAGADRTVAKVRPKTRVEPGGVKPVAPPKPKPRVTKVQPVKVTPKAPRVVKPKKIDSVTLATAKGGRFQVYHGSSRQVSGKLKLGTGEAHPREDAKLGVFFTASYESASNWAGSKGVVLVRQLSLKKPKIVSGYEELKSQIAKETFGRESGSAEKIRDYLLDQGYDSVIYRNTVESQIRGEDRGWVILLRNEK